MLTHVQLLGVYLLDEWHFLEPLTSMESIKVTLVYLKLLLCLILVSKTNNFHGAQVQTMSFFTKNTLSHVWPSFYFLVLLSTNFLISREILPKFFHEGPSYPDGETILKPGNHVRLLDYLVWLFKSHMQSSLIFI